ncbi:MAG: DNA primase [Kiritimatiellae bacterium]|jgi:DNA primase|nr:DNA primase [Kiritimatiellia bacterium]
MAGITEECIAEIRNRADIVDVIGSYIQLSKAGSTYKACCPFHKEKTPSFNVNPNMQIFKCFGCGKAGNVFSFIMEYEGLDFLSTVKMLADKTGVEIKYNKGYRPKGEGEKSDLYQVNKKVAEFYYSCLSSDKGKPAVDYLKSREITGEMAKEFTIGYAPEGWDTLINWAKSQKITEQDLDKLGLLSQSEKSDHQYDRFRNRLMFTIHDDQGRVVGFSGRILEGSKEKAKYVNTPQTPIFYKSKLLYGLHKARRAILDKQDAIICEGQIDVIRCHSAGFQNAIASQGTAFTEEHADKLKRYTDAVTIVFDSDSAGKQATIKTARIFIKAGMAVRAAIVPEGEDPDSYILKNGQEGFQKLLDEAMSIVSFQYNYFRTIEDITTDVGMMRASKQIMETINISTSEIQKAKMSLEAAELLNIPLSALQSDLKFRVQGTYTPPPKKQAKRETRILNPQTLQPLPYDEKSICEIIASNFDNAEVHALVRDYLPNAIILSPVTKKFIDAALWAHESDEDIQDLLAEDADNQQLMTHFSATMFMEPNKFANTEATAVSATQLLIIAIWKKYFQHQYATLQNNYRPEDDKKRSQLTYDKNNMTSWETAEPIIKIAFEKIALD